MREIKFRAIFDGKMIYGENSFYVAIHPNGAHSIVLLFDKFNEPHFIGDGRLTALMEMSPFIDKNGKNIYEGDILGDWNDIDGKMVQSRYAVFFCETTGQWMIDESPNQDRSYSVSLFDELNDFEYEVLGTIHDQK